jgi:transcriptional regulator with XRE-family HTH domain
MQIAKNVKRLREMRGLTQETLAAKVGIHRVYLAKIEMGVNAPSLDLLERLAKARKVNHAPVYKGHRIHISRRYSGPYISMIVRRGTPKPRTKNSVTDTVARAPGEYPSEDEAIQAAMRYSDEADSRRQEKGGKTEDPPRPRDRTGSAGRQGPPGDGGGVGGVTPAEEIGPR